MLDSVNDIYCLVSELGSTFELGLEAVWEILVEVLHTLRQFISTHVLNKEWNNSDLIEFLFKNTLMVQGQISRSSYMLSIILIMFKCGKY